MQLTILTCIALQNHLSLGSSIHWRHSHPCRSQICCNHACKYQTLQSNRMVFIFVPKVPAWTLFGPTLLWAP